MRRLLSFLLALAGLALAQQATTLARIEADPTAYADQEVVLVGYLWNWYDPRLPEVCEGLPTPKGNLMRTRSDGSFCDGTRIAHLPPLRHVPPGGRAVQLVARVHIGPEGWWLEPLVVR